MADYITENSWKYNFGLNKNMGIKSYSGMNFGNFMSSDSSQDMSKSAINWGDYMQKAGMGIKSFASVMQYNEQVAGLDSAERTINLQQEEMDRKFKVQNRLLRRQKDTATSRQLEAFTKAGVKLEGSALDVMSDTYFDMLEAQGEMMNDQRIANENFNTQRQNIANKRTEAKVGMFTNIGTSIMGGLA